MALALAGGLGLGVVTAVAGTYMQQWLAAHPLSWVNVGNVGDGVSFVWIVVLLLAWRRPMALQRQPATATQGFQL